MHPLDRIVNQAISAPTDAEFYLSVHNYFSYISNHEPLAKKLDDLDAEYHRKHHNIWKERHLRKLTDEENDIREEETKKMEMFDVYCRYAITLIVRIYEPLEEYMTSIELDAKQDPVALLMLYGKKKAQVKMPNTDFSNYARWFDGMREDYQNNLTRFHTFFMLDLPKETEDTSKSTKLISLKNTDCMFNDKVISFNPTSQAFKVLKLLIDAHGESVTYLTLIQSYYPHITKASKPEIQKLAVIIRNLKHQLHILGTKGSNPNIIENVKSVGYRIVEPK